MSAADKEESNVTPFRLLQVRRYMPYGSGSRECLGMPQARVTMLATLAAMLSRFSFRLADKASRLASVLVRLSEESGMQTVFVNGIINIMGLILANVTS